MNDSDSAARRRRPTWGAAAGILLVLAAAATVMLATGNGGNQHRPSAVGTAHSRASSPAAASPASALPAAGACRTAPPSTSIPSSPPRDLAWRNVGAILAPTSASEGPTRYRGPIWSCYAHSPMGAVLATYDILDTLTGTQWKAVAEHEILPGPGQKAFIEAGDKQKYQPPKPGSVAQPVGFQVVSYTPQQATISALAEDGTTQYQVTQTSVAWSGGDWKLVVEPDGSSGPDPQVVSSSAGFVLWGGGGGD